jgi:hypothetical protein
MLPRIRALRWTHASTTPNDNSGGVAKNQDLSSLRTLPFLEEPLRDGNILVMIPDQTSDVKVRCQQQRAIMAAKIASIEKKFGGL